MIRTRETRLTKLEATRGGSAGRVVVIKVRDGFVDEDQATCLAILAAAGEPVLGDETIVMIRIMEGRDGVPLPPSEVGVVHSGALR